MLTLLLALALAAPPENPYLTAKVGDWAEYKTDVVVERHTVTARTDDSVTLRIDQTVQGKKGESKDVEIDLKVKVSPNPKTEKLDSGKETITVGGKKYDCEWVKRRFTVTVTVDGKDRTTVHTAKEWVCKDVPLGGTVRIEFESGGVSGVTELTGFGRGK
jgi:hypothetical protein